ncbi:Serine threonine protein kinase [Colletotrichum higginsianum IMI 349063]|uniref:Serine threonine protein kinase n=3 Tax=Colletotrichum higginsianum (strain IMI 349063) TaxID=759273 RepID=A0A1B7Y0C0_COLHI|nr:Serine threonine protein kinase [Colletotrichum higginsianum IMI 349063]OBR05452.1 Serine threonine protein kinase [Colletotrichum higginsianum IMI 349063]
MEAAGLVIGVLGIVIAFKGALDTALLLEDFIEDNQSEPRHWALRYHIQKCRLKAWGDHWNAADEKHCALGTKSENFMKAIELILNEIKRLNEKADKLVQKHDISQDTGVMKRRFRWYIKTNSEFRDIVEKFQDLVDDLEGFTYPSNQLQLLTKAFLPQMLAEIQNLKMLEHLSVYPPADDQTLALSAKAKLLQEQLSRPGGRAPTPIWLHKPKFELVDNDISSVGGLGLIKETEEKIRPVWVEWNVTGSGLESRLHVERMEALGKLLKGVSEPALRLPPFYGIYDDLDYELTHGIKRIGYVFGTPESVTDYDQRVHSFRNDVCENPPISLSALMASEGTAPPLLGDRFRLAFTLASAFSLFHAAGWLHKGLHSGNIQFLREVDGTVSVTQPFITGFQYSRHQNQASLSRGPLDDKRLSHYYHPDAAKGFSKRLDLYSLGVVLCEIGRWASITSKIPKERLRKMTNREAWRSYILDSRLKELGWRMGKQYQDAVRVLLECDLPDDKKLGHVFFAQEFQRKVLQPLSRCNV